MARRRWFLLRFLLPAVFLLLGCPPPAPPVNTLTTFGLGGHLTPGSEAHFLAVLPPSIEGAARANRSIELSIQQPGREAELVWRGRTDDTGAAQIVFDVPDAVPSDNPQADPNTHLSFSIDAGSGTVFAERTIIISAVDDILLTTDKPVYQPGQLLHLRGLALNRATMEAAANAQVLFTVTDPAGNKVLKQESTTSSFGIATADLPLHELAPPGDYTIEAQVGEYHVSSSVEVKPYTLPRFKVEFSPARTWYLPGQVVTGTVSANYFFGKPVAGGDVSLKGFVTDVARVEAVTATGVTDASGIYTFTFTMPATFASSADDEVQGVRTARLEMLVEVTDKAQHLERIDDEITIAESALLVEVTPEAGAALITGADNLLYVDVSFPDGSPAQATVRLEGEAMAQPISVTTDAAGLATITLPADDVARAVPAARFKLNAVALDNPDQGATRRLRLHATNGLLLRPDAAEYAVGETLRLDLYAPPNVDTVYLSIDKNGESHAFATLPVHNGMAQAELAVDGALLGTLGVQAFANTIDGVGFNATRYVLVNPAPALLDVQADAATWRPGETATVNISVSQDGAPLPAALGVSVVDESVYALGESDPGFARTYFLLSRTLQEPRFGIDGFSELKDSDPSPYDASPLNTALPAQSIVSATSRNTALAGYFAQAGATTATSSPALRTSPLWAYAARLPFALPLLGFAIYDGSRKRRRILFGLLIVAVAAALLVSCAAPAMPGAPASSAPAGEAAAAPAGIETTATRGGAAPPRLRQFFPETLLWLPEVKTDAEGKARIDVALADTITTWRMSIIASDRAGNLGSATIGLQAFQDFFIEPDLPTLLTVDDEIELPVSIFNYADAPQEVALRVEPAAWFTFTSPPPTTVSVAANDVTVAYVPMRMIGAGEQTLRIDAQSATLADAVARTITVVPNAEPQAQANSALLNQATMTFAAVVPEESLPGASTVTFKIYPGALSQMTDGLQSLIQEPHGCFEQVTSTLYPAVLALETLRRTGATDPALEQRGNEIIRSGYQQLLAYEVDNVSGGFSYWGDPPPLMYLTAYGLMQFADMAEVAWVDPALIERTANFLMAQQQSDGSWPTEFAWGYSGALNAVNSTASVTWALADAGYTDTQAVQRGLEYIRSQLTSIPASTPVGGPSGGSTAGQPRPGRPYSPLPPPLPAPALADIDVYTLAIATNALLAAGEDASPYLALLAAQALPAEKALNMQGIANNGAGVVWNAGSVTWTGADGYWADVETSALATCALMRSGEYADTAHEGLAYLLGQRGPNGAVGTTQATVFTLKSLLLTTEEQRGDTTITFTLAETGEQQVIELPADGLNVVQEATFAGLDPGSHRIEVVIDGPQRPVSQMIVSSYRPWGGPVGRSNDSMRLDVAYDRTAMAVNDTVWATATVELLSPGGANMLLVRLGIPPGFEVAREDWEAMVRARLISDYELHAHEVRVYLARVVTNQPIVLRYSLQARLPVRAAAPGASAYDYYRPDVQDTAEPVQIVVRRVGGD